MQDGSFYEKILPFTTKSGSFFEFPCISDNLGQTLVNFNQVLAQFLHTTSETEVNYYYCCYYYY